MPLTLGIKAIATAAVLTVTVAAGSWTVLTRKPAPFETVKVTLKSGTVLEAGRDEITHALWMECVAAKACGHEPKTKPPSGFYPVTDVNALDIKEFINWLQDETHAAWRLPTREEALEFSNLLPKDETKRMFTDPRLSWADDYYSRKSHGRAVKPSGSFGDVPGGLRDIGGNVWEWTSTCVAKNIGKFMCPAYYVNGEHEAEIPTFLRDAISGGCASGTPPANLGFRLVRDDAG
jgi:formylglycine-generating enzyme required for sulfatase activity